MLYKILIGIALVFWLLADVQPDVNLSATWQRPGVARITWEQPADVAQTCLYRTPSNTAQVFIGCWQQLPADTIILMLPGATQNDYTWFPAVGDVYILTMDGDTVASEPLRGVLRLPAFYV